PASSFPPRRSSDLVGGAGVAVAAANQVAGQFGPVAFEAGHGGLDRFAAQAVGAQFSADVARPVAAAGAAAHQRFGKARVVLPAGVGELGDGRQRLFCLHAPRGELAGQLPPRVLASGQQAQRALGGRGRLARPAAPGRVVAHAAGASPWPPTGRGRVCCSRAGDSGIARALPAVADRRASDALCISAQSQSPVFQAMSGSHLSSATTYPRPPGSAPAYSRRIDRRASRCTRRSLALPIRPYMAPTFTSVAI